MPDLPAEKAGVLTGDIVVAVDDLTLPPEISVEETVALIRGKVGTVVRLTLEREGAGEPVIVEIERQVIPTPSIEWRMLEESEGTAYLRITSFTGRTDIEVRDAMEELQDLGMEELVLDLRGNGGGLFDAAIDVSSRFLESGVVLYQVEKGGAEQEYTVRGGRRWTGMPMVVLIDGGTASASEIVAGALRDRDRAKLVGETTYGKGSVQTLHSLSDGSSVHITSAKWLTPARRQIEGDGLGPDVQIAFSEEAHNEGRDAQLERAVELLETGG
jgi:carboxyl-terminal processing protease